MASQQPFMNNYPGRQQQQGQQNLHHIPPPPQHMPPSSAIIDDDAIAAADKEMEERANRAKDLLSQRYDAIRQQQVSSFCFQLYAYWKNSSIPHLTFGCRSLCIQ
jgi:hypothetical protein